ncbi:hypothetical protein Tco_1339511, partial [Tanacetum coccineum]
APVHLRDGFQDSGSPEVARTTHFAEDPYAYIIGSYQLHPSTGLRAFPEERNTPPPTGLES